MKIVIHLHDWLDYRIHITEVEHPLKKFYMWGDRAFEKVSQRHYRETSVGIIYDTSDQAFKCIEDSKDSKDPKDS